MAQVNFAEGAAPSTPSSGVVAVYAKTDGRIYGKDDTGVEFSMSGPIIDTAVTLTNQTSVDFTIPAGAKRITLNFVGVSSNGTSNLMIQLGDSGGIEPTGYLGSASTLAAATSATLFTTGYGLTSGQAAAAIYHGTITITNQTGNTWTAAGCLARSDAAQTSPMAGSKTLSATLTTVRLTTVNGTDQYDAGTINVSYE